MLTHWYRTVVLALGISMSQAYAQDFYSMRVPTDTSKIAYIRSNAEFTFETPEGLKYKASDIWSVNDTGIFFSDGKQVNFNSIQHFSVKSYSVNTRKVNSVYLMVMGNVGFGTFWYAVHGLGMTPIVWGCYRRLCGISFLQKYLRRPLIVIT